MLARIRRRLTYTSVVAALCVFVALLASTATAPAGDYNYRRGCGLFNCANYDGHIRGVPGTQFDLAFFKHSGRWFLHAISTDNIPATCENGPGLLRNWEDQINFGEGRFVGRDRDLPLAFDIRKEMQSGDYIRVAGELKRRRAVGIFKQRATFDQPLGVCKTGKLEWVAEH